MADDKQIVRDLANLVENSHFFHGRHKNTQAPKLTAALRGLVAAFGDSQSPKVLDQYRNQIDRLKAQLNNCFENDISLWRTDQKALFLSRTEGLSLRLISETVTKGPARFWYHHLVRYGPHRSYCASSEPLFFYSKSLNAYIRFLDINLDLPSLKPNAAKLGNDARKMLDSKLAAHGFELKPTKTSVQPLDFSPARLYIPAGDASGISWIRRWFRKRLNGVAPPPRMERNQLPADNGSTLNRIVLASRCTNPSLQYLRSVHPNLKFDLTESGIRIGSRNQHDEVGANGTTLAHVVVTNWVFEGGHAYSIIASNHTRAAGRVAQLLVAESEGKDPDPRPYLNGSLLIKPDGTIPERMQMIFSVKLNVYESQANDPELLDEPKFYDPA